jgi:CubicO group peptidase (beta-lactamase class C family)
VGTGQITGIGSRIPIRATAQAATIDTVTAAMPPLPPQPAGVPWPAPGFDGWPLGEPDPGVVELVDELFGDVDRFGETYAVVVVQGGRLTLERYAGALPSFEHDPIPVEPSTALLSWSMAKSITHALVGLLVADGVLDLDAPAAVPEWVGDARAAITLQQLLEMRSGLRWREDYVDAGASDVIEMLFGGGRADTAAFAANRPLEHEPGTTFVYSSGTTNIVTRLLGAHADVGALLRDRLFGPIGVPQVDAGPAAAAVPAGEVRGARARHTPRAPSSTLATDRWQPWSSS